MHPRPACGPTFTPRPVRQPDGHRRGACVGGLVPVAAGAVRISTSAVRPGGERPDRDCPAGSGPTGGRYRAHRRGSQVSQTTASPTERDRARDRPRACRRLGRVRRPSLGRFRSDAHGKASSRRRRAPGCEDNTGVDLVAVPDNDPDHVNHDCQQDDHDCHRDDGDSYVAARSGQASRWRKAVDLRCESKDQGRHHGPEQWDVHSKATDQERHSASGRLCPDDDHRRKHQSLQDRGSDPSAQRGWASDCSARN